MRGIVIGKMLVLTLWGLYLAVGLSQPTKNGGSTKRVAETSHCQHQDTLVDLHEGRFSRPSALHRFQRIYRGGEGRSVPVLRSVDFAPAPAQRTAQARQLRCQIPPGS